MMDEHDGKIDDGGPAFPVADLSKTQEPGMSLRDWFAGMAMQGLVAQSRGTALNGIKVDAEYAYMIADAMLKARKER